MNNAERFWAKVDKTDGCWEWTGCVGDGYGQIGLNGKIIRTHRLSYIIHHPLTINLLEHREICVCHKCDNRKCVNPAHLFLGSKGDNNKDRETKGRGNQQKGEKHGRSKLTETDVREIRTRYANGGISQQQLALEYGVSQKLINLIIHRENWKHI
jgi:ribosome-binding protein aMBF1 (putative translation factor)